MRKTISSILVLFVLFLSQLPSQKGIILKPVISTTLKAKPSVYTGECPVTIMFPGTIKVNKAMAVQYQFVFSNASKSRVKTLNFKGPGIQKVQTTWRVSKSLSGWAALRIISPSVRTRPTRAGFKVACKRKLKPGALAPDQTGQSKPIPVGSPKIIISPIKFNQGTDKPRNQKEVSDLIIHKIAKQPYEGRVNEAITFSITIRNISRMRMQHSPPCKLKVVFRYESSNPLGSGYKSDPFFYDIPQIISGGQCLVEFKLKFPVRKVWWMDAMADGNNTVKELEENNNKKTTSFRIR